MKKYAFVDRDGTMIFEPQDTFQIDSLEKLQILPDVIESLKKLQDEGFVLVMVSNQNGIGSSSFPKENFEIPQNALLNKLKSQGVAFEQILVCPHFPEAKCDCRKPKTGLVEHIKDIDKARSIVIGDRDTDLEFAKNLGIRGVKVPLNQGMTDLVLQLRKN